ncbi:MAG: hypothetical protein M1832_005721 [Thelocarpon impressellum]|nr:MAG: hypothetical protein M1832_005721 [Thelocarpon impressellum]
MAPQQEIPLAANILGTIGTAGRSECEQGLMTSSSFWCIQLIPQIFSNWRHKNTDGLPGSMMFLWALCGVPFGVYAVVQNFNIPIQVQPQMFCALALISWAQTLVYHNKWTSWKAAALTAGIAVVFGGIETLLVLTLRGPYNRGVEFPMIIIGVVAAVLLSAGFVPAYREMFKRRGQVVGIDFCFLTIDWLGAFFSLMALVAQHTFDILGGCLYISCLILEAGIFTSHVLWLLRTRAARAANGAGDSCLGMTSVPPTTATSLDLESQRTSGHFERAAAAEGKPAEQALSDAVRVGEKDL